jgi:hypothetical protein
VSSRGRSAAARDREFRIAPFRFDVTPPLGHALLGGWIEPARAIDDALEAIGYVLLDSEQPPLVVCAVDWAGLLNDAHLAWRTTLAAAAGTTPHRVAVHCVHQHNAPFVCPTARAVAARDPELPEMFDPEFFEMCLKRATECVRDAVSRAARVTHVAHARAAVKDVASNRRVARDADGRVTAMRASSCTDPALIALPRGTVDPWLQTVAYYGDDGRKLVACHYYATHPMSFYRDGRVTSDFCGLARKRRQADDPDCTQLYFTGCAGNISAGKYNDGTPASRVALTERMHAAMVTSEQNLRPRRLRRVDWKTESILPPPHSTPRIFELEAGVMRRDAPLVERLLPAFRLGWLERVNRGVPLVLSRLRLNSISILHLPGEMFVEYQLRARAMRPRQPVAVAAYGDDGLWYVPTKEEYPAGGYEVGVAFCRDEVDSMMTEAIRRLLNQAVTMRGKPLINADDR